MTSKKSWKEVETLKERGTKRYRERIAEEKEAEQLIRDYEEETDEFPEREIDDTNEF